MQLLTTRLDTTQPELVALTVPPCEQEAGTNEVARHPVPLTVPPLLQVGGGPALNAGTKQPVPVAFTDALVQKAALNTGWVQLPVAMFAVPPAEQAPVATTEGLQPSRAVLTTPFPEQEAGMAAKAAIAGLPPILARNATAAGDSAAGTTTLAADPAVTLKLTDGSFKRGRLSDFREPSGAERAKIAPS